MPDEPKLKVLPRKRRKLVKSKIRARANEQVKQAAVEARKVATLEYVAEQIEELVSLLRAEGFKPSRRETVGQLTGVAAPIASVVKNPCALCGREGVVMNETKTGWLCQTHGQYELGGAIQDRAGQTLAQEMMAPKPIAPPPRKPSAPKMVIHPNAAEQSKMIDPLKGVQNGTVGVLGDDSEEAGVDG